MRIFIKAILSEGRRAYNGSEDIMEPIITNRLKMRKFREEDWRAVYAYTQDPQVIQYVPGEAPSEAETQEMICAWMNGENEHPPHYDFAVTIPPNDEVVGWCCIQVSANEKQTAEVRYVLNRECWGKGFATEGTEGVINYAFVVLKMHRVYATCRPGNIIAWHVVEKLGMRREGRLRENVWIRDSWHDSFLYAVLDHEWQAREKEALRKIGETV
jgi:[ribosomal protein S5]-alanine N-acetyltransferase